MRMIPQQELDRLIQEARKDELHRVVIEVIKIVNSQDIALLTPVSSKYMKRELIEKINSLCDV
jgi:hypothetical protein